MKALVLGGTRYFGKRLVDLLLARGAEVTVLNRARGADPFGDRVRRVVMDRKALDSSAPLLAGPFDVIYDMICYDERDAQAALSTFRGRTEQYVFVSSQSVYGPGANLPEKAFDPFTYSYRNPPGWEEPDYAEAKRQAEATFFRDTSFPVCAVRFPIVLGPDDYTGRLLQHVRWVREGTPFHLPAPHARLSFVSSADAAAFLLTQADHFRAGPVNVCSPDPISLRDLLREISQAVGRAPVLAESGEASPLGIESDWFMDASRMRQGGFEATPLREWLPQLVRQLVAKETP